MASARTFRNARILIVDDEPGNVDVLRKLLHGAGFHQLEATTDARNAASQYIHFRPDLILLDLHMPHMDGLAVLDQLDEIVEASYLPILMLTGDISPEARRDALSRGAKDFINKPFDRDEVLLRIRTLLETRFRSPAGSWPSRTGSTRSPGSARNKSAWPVDQAVAEIDRQRGQQFDPLLVDAFPKVIERELHV